MRLVLQKVDLVAENKDAVLAVRRFVEV